MRVVLPVASPSQGFERAEKEADGLLNLHNKPHATRHPSYPPSLRKFARVLKLESLKIGIVLEREYWLVFILF